MKPLPIFLTGVLLAFSPVAFAHEGHQHAEPPVAAPPPTSAMDALAVSGSGAAFEAVLKHAPLQPGAATDVTLFLLNASTNGPVDGATVKGTFSTGDTAQEVAFAEVSGGLPGDYRATVTPAGSGASSWLLDVEAGGEIDLIGIQGYRAPEASAGTSSTAPAVSSHSHDDHSHGVHVLALISASVVALIAGTMLGRSTTRRAEA